MNPTKIATHGIILILILAPTIIISSLLGSAVKSQAIIPFLGALFIWVAFHFFRNIHRHLP